MLPIVDFGKLFEGTLDEADLEKIRALLIGTKSPEISAEVVNLLHQYSALLDVAHRTKLKDSRPPSMSGSDSTESTGKLGTVSRPFFCKTRKNSYLS